VNISLINLWSFDAYKDRKKLKNTKIMGNPSPPMPQESDKEQWGPVWVVEAGFSEETI
jgi:hypothetical protein